MTREDTIGILSILRGAYPNFYRGITKAEANDTINLWASLFVDDQVQVVTAAVKSFIVSDTKGFPPVPGQVKEYIRKLTMPEEMGEAEAWALIAKAIRNSGYESEKEFKALPEDLQRIVGSPSQLRDWSMMDSDTVHSVVASNVQRAYRVRQQSKKERAALPKEVLAMIEQTVSRAMLEGKNEHDERAEAETP